MKILDEKGKLFGKLNLIDLIVVLVIIAVVVAVGWKLGGSAVTEAIGSTGTPIRYEVLCARVDPDTSEFAESHVGGQLMSNGDMVDGTIVSCVVEPYTEVLVDSEGNPQMVENPAYRNLRFTIEVNAVDAANAYSIGSQELRVGKSHIVKTTELEVNGTITSMEVLNADE